MDIKPENILIDNKKKWNILILEQQDNKIDKIQKHQQQEEH